MTKVDPLELSAEDHKKMVVTKIDEVARAIKCKAEELGVGRYFDHGDLAITLALAAVRAMREPNANMRREGFYAVRSIEDAELTYQAMIDAAIAEHEG